MQIVRDFYVILRVQQIEFATLTSSTALRKPECAAKARKPLDRTRSYFGPECDTVEWSVKSAKINQLNRMSTYGIGLD